MNDHPRNWPQAAPGEYDTPSRNAGEQESSADGLRRKAAGRNSRVNERYGLTEEEIRIVEGAGNGTIRQIVATPSPIVVKYRHELRADPSPGPLRRRNHQAGRSHLLIPFPFTDQRIPEVIAQQHDRQND